MFTYLRGEILHCTERLAVWLLFLHEHIAGKHTDQKTVLKYDFCFLSGQTVEKHTQNRDTTFKKKKGERKNIFKNPDSREKHFGCWKCHNLAFLRIVNRKEYNLCCFVVVVVVVGCCCCCCFQVSLLKLILNDNGVSSVICSVAVSYTHLTLPTIRSV